MVAMLPPATRVYEPDIITQFFLTYYNWIILAASLFVIVYGIRWYYLTRYKK
jgi:hypothetical protein